IGLPVVGWFLAARLRTAFARALDSQVHLTDEFMNSIHKPDEVQLMGAAPQRAKAFAKRVKSLVHDQFQAEAGRELANAFQNAMPALLQVVLLMYGIFVALQNGSLVAAGAIVALYQLVPQAISPIQELLQIAAAFTASWPQVEAVIEVFEAEPEGGKKDGTLELAPNDRSVTFRDVSFAYAPDHPKIVDGVSHVFPAGKVTAIVARFGTGKSTVLNLIARLRRPIGGSILIGDKGLGQIKRASLRINVVKVSQFPLLISDTVRENFRLAKADATDAEIEAVSRRTGLWDVLVKETPPGEDPLAYMVSRQDGVGLSGGQRRILAVTRALLLEPTVLLLDEPTTGIDPIGRHEIYDTLAKACAGLTVVVVDQDINFISHFAQQICCLEGGKFADIGSPAELMQRPSLFKRLSEASQQ
ncbi:MAG: ATP-binding cassette domain-containing protein, partial [Hyphomicrobiales bacterium]